TAADAKGLLKTAIRGEDPVLFLEHKALYRAAAARTPEPDADYLLPMGKARLHREGTDLTVVTYGMMVHKAMNVARQVAKEDGAEVEILDLRSLLPLDREAILASVKKTSRVLVLYEDHEFTGYGAEIAAQIAADAFEHLDAPVRRLAGAFSFVPFADPLERAVLPQDEDVLQAVRAVLAY
ncbi:MAG: transketolase C-terminal domain-containing protein, partial [Rhodothermales bacterium]|nr:transketolase C-terminal domain-containing protein [Rhodothermales bacterium]